MGILSNDPEFVEVFNRMKDQLLLILVERLGGDVILPLSEIDESPVGKILTVDIVKSDVQESCFQFTVRKKR